MSSPLGHEFDKKKMTPHEQKLADEATTFVLAGCMVSVYRAILTKDSLKLTNMLKQVTAVLKQDPGFLARFEAAQASVMRHYNDILREDQAAMGNPPPPPGCPL